MIEIAKAEERIVREILEAIVAGRLPPPLGTTKAVKVRRFLERWDERIKIEGELE